MRVTTVFSFYGHRPLWYDSNISAQLFPEQKDVHATQSVIICLIALTLKENET